MARFNAKTICTVRHVYMTTMTVLIMLQTRRFILTVSPPADLEPLPNKNTLSFCDPIHKINNICCALSIGKKKNSVYFAARDIALLWSFFHLNCSVAYLALSNYYIEFVALAVVTMKLVEWEFLLCEWSPFGL